jgi:hypothetical protein
MPEGLVLTSFYLYSTLCIILTMLILYALYTITTHHTLHTTLYHRRVLPVHELLRQAELPGGRRSDDPVPSVAPHVPARYVQYIMCTV